MPMAAPCHVRVDRQPLLGILGVISHSSSEQRALRDSLRETARVGQDVVPLHTPGNKGRLVSRFVLRVSDEVLRLPNGTVATRDEVQSEAKLHADVVLIEQGCAQSGVNLRCPGGALRSTLAWLRCALIGWPAALTVGKAETDTYLHLPGVAHHLQQSVVAMEKHSAHIAASQPPQLFWGAFESYHCMTHPKYHSPRGHLNGYMVRSCRVDPMPIGRVGPFSFAKGPLLFLSSPLAMSVLSSPTVQQEAEAAILKAEAIGGTMRVWEDVFLGFAVATSAQAPVHVVDDPALQSESGHAAPRLSPATLVAHLRRNKSATFVRRVHRYLKRRHCQPKELRIRFHDEIKMTLCSGARLFLGHPGHVRGKHVYNHENCSTVRAPLASRR